MAQFGTLADAMHLAATLHEGQTRKGSSVPYVEHLMGVASHILQAGGTQEQAIAGLLHDAIEDQGDKIDAAEIERRFGQQVAEYVSFSSESDRSLPWAERKSATVQKIRKLAAEGRADALLIVLADKAQNLEGLLRGLWEQGPDYWSHFNAPPEQQLMLYNEYLDALSECAGLDAYLLQRARSFLKQIRVAQPA